MTNDKWQMTNDKKDKRQNDKRQNDKRQNDSMTYENMTDDNLKYDNNIERKKWQNELIVTKWQTNYRHEHGVRHNN